MEIYRGLLQRTYLIILIDIYLWENAQSQKKVSIIQVLNYYLKERFYSVLEHQLGTLLLQVKNYAQIKVLKVLSVMNRSTTSLFITL